MIHVRCKVCGSELFSHSAKPKSCGCSNMTTVKGDTITAVNLADVVMVNSDKNYEKKKSKSNVLSSDDLAFQEARRQRKVRKLDFEVR